MMREFFNGRRWKAGCVTLALACPLFLAIGCVRKSSPPGVSSTAATVESSSTEQVTNELEQTTSEFYTSVQLPDIAYWVKAGGRHFEDHGVRDATAPNMMLSQWNHANVPRPTALQPATAKALHQDTALALDLREVYLTPQLKQQLSKLHRLQWLSLSLGVTTTDLSWLRDMKSLRGLALTHANLDKTVIENLAQAKQLQYLTLSRSEFTESDFEEFPKLEKLETVRLSGRHVSDACVLRLAKLRLPALRSLGLEESSITDLGLHSLCDVYDLEWLNLYRCKNISEKSVASLGKMQRLHLVGVGGTGIAPLFQPTAAVHDLQRLLPKCILDHGD